MELKIQSLLYKLNIVIRILPLIRLGFQIKPRLQRPSFKAENQVSFSRVSFGNSCKTVLSQHEASQPFGNISRL